LKPTVTILALEYHTLSLVPNYTACTEAHVQECLCYSTANQVTNEPRNCIPPL